jgi:cell division ATPase FtsA
MKGAAKESYIEKSVQIQVPSKIAGDEPVKITTRFLATIIEARLEEMLEPIFEMIESYNGELLRGIFITGNGSKLNNLPEYIQEKTGLETRYGDHSGWLSSDTPDEYRDIQYAQLIGTVLLAHDYRLSHLPEVEEQAKKKQGGPGKSIKERFAQNFIRFFEDDKVLQE